jgi:glycyl-tRNA synthetase
MAVFDQERASPPDTGRINPDRTERMAAETTEQMEQLVALCKRRGFVFQASEIYGGLNGFWDWGPLGIQLKNNIRDDWWRSMVECPPTGPDGRPLQIVGLDSAIIQNPRTWVASGHVEGFNDPMVDCRECKARFRADKVATVTFLDGQKLLASVGVQADNDETAVANARSEVNSKTRRKLDKAENLEAKVAFLSEIPENVSTVCPACGVEGALTQPRLFNMMFETYVGAIRDEDAKAYLRPETAQGIFLNYRNVLDTMRVQVPFGIAQIGKAFRNEVTPRNYVFRSREFEQMEMEWFCPPDEALMWYDFWKTQRMEWWESLGVSRDRLIFRDHDADELAFYSQACVDVEYRYPFTAPGFGELEGIAHRGDYDLTRHQVHSKAKMEYFDQELQQKLKDEGLDKDQIKKRSRYIPHVIEPASGLTRGALVLLCEAYTPDEDRPSGVYMKFHPRMAPIKAGIFPLVNKDGMPEVAQKLYMDLRDTFTCQFDVKQNIGKRYARMDEVGTPFCFTVDGQTLEDQTVTVRHRDTQQQDRIAIDQVHAFLAEKIGE